MATNFQRLTMQRGGAVPADKWNALLAELQRAQVLEVSGYQSVLGTSGRVFTPTKPNPAAGGAAAPDVRPFDVTVSGTGATRDVTLVPGVVNNLLPTNMFATLSVSETGAWYVVLNVDLTAGEVVSASLAVEGTSPAAFEVGEGVPASLAKVLIAVIVDAAVFQIRRGNVVVVSSTAFVVSKSPAAAPGELPYVPYYQLAVTTS